jgi:hypothetical protein
MCSHAARGEDAAEMAAVSGARFVVVDMPTRANFALPDFETSHFRQAQVGSHGDLSRKRNLGLLLGWLASWQTVLFLDDDISGLNPVQVTRAVSALTHFAAVGMPARRFPDNSVVCHAHRLSGGKQGVFVSASALAVNLGRIDTFFPDIYNEDWLFLAPHVDRHHVASYGSVRQQSYSPFAYPHRAGAQEFGDVLAEGLLGYLHATRLHRPPSVEYWREFLARRADFITVTMRRLLDVEEPNAEVIKALTALKIAQSARAKISAEVLNEYVHAWLGDLRTWQNFLGKLPRTGNLSDAFRFLDLSTVKVPASLHATSEVATR